MHSIGHSNHPIDKFLDLLRAHRIELLIDVRSQPFSKYSPHFDLDQLKAYLTGARLAYDFRGNELGGRPRGAEFYDADGCVLYSRMAEWPVFRSAIDRLVADAGSRRLAIMCSEEDPAECHRHLLIGRVLAGRGVVLQHIRGDGSVQSYEEVRKASDPNAGQLSLFGQEPKPWKSVRSVSPRNPPANSSEP